MWLGVFCVVAALLIFLLILARWKIFAKAGEKPWKSIIPIYSDYITIKISWATKFFWIMLLLSLAIGICSAVVQTVGVNNATTSWILLAVVTVAGITLFIMEIIAVFRLSKSFGHGVPFTLGLLFLPNIFLLILGLGSSRYYGNIYQKSKELIQ